ncbi:hypothetical protein MTO96_018793 [Rhipicephalus appendiculatus]
MKDMWLGASSWWSFTCVFDVSPHPSHARPGISVLSTSRLPTRKKSWWTPLDTLREKCRAEGKCAGFGEKLQECSDRVNSRSQTLETCEEELFDFLHCVDHCASKDIFKHLK